MEFKKMNKSYTINQYSVSTVLNENLNNLNLKLAMYDNNLWHKVLIHKGAGSNVKDILQLITKLALPNELVPVNIKVLNAIDLEFICNACGPAIETICKLTNLVLKHGNYLLPITLTIGYSDINDPQINISKSLADIISINNRYDPKTGTLNLESFNKIKGIENVAYCNLFNLNSLLFILYMLQLNQIIPLTLNLSSNNIETIDERFVKHEIVKNITSINLQYNKIKTLEDIVPLKLMNIREITLTDNPICETFESAVDYVLTIKKLLPTIEVIDGIAAQSFLTSVPRIPFYVTSKSAEYIVDQFLEHYFTVYDNNALRKNLKHLYHHHAMFSMTSSIVSLNIENEYGLQKYENLAHNLLKWNKCDYDIGSECITKKLCYLPQTKHIPQSFCIDVLQYTENKNIVFVINGVFKESKQNPIKYNFTRTFFLLAGENGEYFIINDMLYVTNADVEPIRIILEKTCNNDTLKIALRPATNTVEKNKFIECFTELTTLHEDYAREYLDLVNWNFREALEKFVYNVKFDLIPKEYFTSGFSLDPVELLKKGPIEINKLDETSLTRILLYFNIKFVNRCDFCPLKPKWCSATHWKQIRYELLKMAKKLQLPVTVYDK